MFLQRLNAITIGRRCAALRCFIVAVALIVAIPSQGAARDIWSRGDVGGLFPLAPDGWTATRIELEPLKLPTTDLELFFNALNENYDADASIRLRAVRHYHQDDREISITLDSDDIDNAINIDAIMAALSSGDEATRTQLESDGFSAIAHDGVKGVGVNVPDKKGRAFRIGSAGVIALECSYSGCEDLLERMIAQLDFKALVEFAEFDHRLQEK